MGRFKARYLVISIFVLHLFSFSIKGQETPIVVRKYPNESIWNLHTIAQNQLGDKQTLSSLRNYLSLINEIEKTNDPELIAQIYIEVAFIYKQELLFEKSLEYFQKANLLIVKSDNEKYFIIQENLGNVFSKLKRYAKAREHYLKAIDYAESKNNTKAIISLYQSIVATYKNSANYNNALEYYLKILELTKKESDKKNEAITLNNIGYVYLHLKEYDRAISYFRKTIEIINGSNYDKTELASLYTNIGIAYQNKGKYDLTLSNLHDARKILEKVESKKELSYLYNLLAMIYFNLKDFHNAKVYNELSLKIAEGNNYPNAKEEIYKTSSLVYQELNDYKKALFYYKMYLSIKDSLMIEERVKQQNILQQQFVVEKTEKELKLLLVGEEIKDLEINRLLLESEKVDKENEILRKDRENNSLRAKETMQALMLTRQEYDAEKKDKQIQLLFQNEQLQGALLKQKELQDEERKKEIQLLTKDKAIDKLEIEKQLTFRKYMYGFSLMLIVFIGLIYRSFVITRKSKRQLERKNHEIYLQKKEIEESHDIIEKEKEKSEQLLLNILPHKIASELKETGKALPQHYKRVSVLFADIVGFTGITEATPAEQLFDELNYFFLKFDEIIETHGLEKIKTIGDAYMCAGGVPQANVSNPYDAVSAGIEISKFMNLENIVRKKKGLIPWGIRIGIHTGPIVAGVVGKNKFVYDIWGDAVNVASRLEGNSENGKVNISEDTFNLVKDKFNCTYRGELDAKNKGKIAMYFVEGIIK